MASTPTRDMQEEFLAATRKSQETVVRAIKTWVETVKTVTPKMPSVYAPLADRLPKLPSVNVPFADRLPKPEDVVASGYDFAEHLLALQRQFAENLLKATEPLIPVNGESRTPAAKSEPKPAPAAPPTPKLVLKAPAAVSQPKTQAAVNEPKPAPAAPATPKPEPKAEVAETAPKAVTVPTAPKAPAVKVLSVADALGGQDERGHTKWKSVEIEGMGFPTSIVGSGRPPIPADALPSVQELGEALVRWHQAKDQEWEAWNALTDDERARLADLAPVPDC